jgi:hypothetical protein
MKTSFLTLCNHHAAFFFSQFANGFRKQFNGRAVGNL